VASERGEGRSAIHSTGRLEKTEPFPYDHRTARGSGVYGRTTSSPSDESSKCGNRSIGHEIADELDMHRLDCEAYKNGHVYFDLGGGGYDFFALLCRRARNSLTLVKRRGPVIRASGKSPIM
jgi:hypothetical protein